MKWIQSWLSLKIRFSLKQFTINFFISLNLIFYSCSIIQNSSSFSMMYSQQRWHLCIFNNNHFRSKHAERDQLVKEARRGIQGKSKILSRNLLAKFWLPERNAKNLSSCKVSSKFDKKILMSGFNDFIIKDLWVSSAHSNL